MATEKFSHEEFDRQDAEAVLRVSRELGTEYDAELVNAFADRIERAVETRAQESRYAVKRPTVRIPVVGVSSRSGSSR